MNKMLHNIDSLDEGIAILHAINNDSMTFSRWRTVLWPIHRSELRLFTPLLIIFFLICFNYSVLRVLKDALVVTAPASGAEIIPFLKVWGVLPGVFLITFLFTYLSGRFSHEVIFYTIIGLFLAFFTLFATLLYPLRDLIHPNTWIDNLSLHLRPGCKGLLAVVRNWSFSLFYIMAELWGSTIMTVLFWGFANEVLSLEKAKRFYTLIMIGGNLASICAGQIVANLSIAGCQEMSQQAAWDRTLSALCFLTICTGLGAIGVFWWYQKSRTVNLPRRAKPPSPRMENPSMKKSLAYLTGSRPLLLLAIIVLSYNVCINLTEVAWKDQLKALYPNPSDYNAYMGKVLTWVGILATILGFATNALIQRTRWSLLAQATPLIMLVTGLGFFSFLFINESHMGNLSTLFGATPLLLCATFGTAQNCFAKASKFTLFDMTKELAFIPLDKTIKLKGKAVVDGLGSRLGKSGGSLLYQSLLIGLGTIGSSLSYIAGAFLLVIALWSYAVYALERHTERQTSG